MSFKSLNLKPVLVGGGAGVGVGVGVCFEIHTRNANPVIQS